MHVTLRPDYRNQQCVDGKQDAAGEDHQVQQWTGLYRGPKNRYGCKPDSLGRDTLEKTTDILVGF